MSSNPPNGDKPIKNIIITKNNTNRTPNTRPPANTNTSTTPTTQSGITIIKPKRDGSKECLFDNVTPSSNKRPTVTTAAPSNPQGPKITFRKKQTVKITFRTGKYTIEEAEQFRDNVKKFFEKQKIQKISDEQFIKMASLLNRFKLTQRPKPKPKQGPEQNRPENKITQELNKLTLDNFMIIIDNLTINNNNFLDIKYLQTLAKCLVEQASNQPLYSSLYSLSAHSISSVLDNQEYTKSRQAFCQTLIQEAQKRVEESINSNSADISVGSASFYGFLANRDFVTIENCFSIVQRLVDNMTPSNIEICRQILIPAGEKIEKKFPEEFKKIVAKLEAATKDKKIPGSIRYPLIDLLEARKDNWETKGLMYVITSTKSSNKNRANNLTQVREKEEEPKIKIEAGDNRFSGLLGSDDDDDYGDDYVDEENVDDGEFDSDDMVRRYVIDNEISPNWKRQYVGDLLFAIALRPNKEISKSMKLLQILNDDNNFAINEEEQQNAFKAICETVKKCSEDKVSDSENYTHAIDNCGTIFARLVYFGISSVDQFGEVFPIKNFRISVVLSFLSEMIKVKQIQLIEESKYWTNYEWRPEGYSNLDITNSIANLPQATNETIFNIFPLYDCLYALQDDVDYLAHPPPPEEADDKFDLEAEIDNFPPDVISDPAFATGAMEILFKFNTCFDVVLPYLDQNQDVVLSWVEKYGLREIRDTKDVANLIKNIANSGNYKLENFAKISGNEKHDEIVQYLKTSNSLK